MPYWMMRNMDLQEGQLVTLESVTLPTATYAKFQPMTEEFLQISNPKAVLENVLRNFAYLTKGDLIAFEYCNKTYEIQVIHLS